MREKLNLIKMKNNEIIIHDSVFYVKKYIVIYILRKNEKIKCN